MRGDFIYIVILTAAGVGCATLLGSLIGLILKKISHKFSDTVLGFAAGIMLAAAVIGLILPSLNDGSAIITIIGVFSGALFLNIIDRFVPHLHITDNSAKEQIIDVNKANKILLFVLAIAIHNLPEGIAVGVGFGTDNYANAITIAGGIALQNIPEGLVIISPLLSIGISKAKTFLIATATGLVEVVGTFIGFYAANISRAILPFALSFAGGTMLYIISDEMIPETHSHGNERSSTYALLFGFCLMLAIDYYL